MTDNATKVTKFELVIDLDKVAGGPPEEVARVLRFWAGNLKHYAFDEPHTEALMDSEYKEVGSWSLS